MTDTPREDWRRKPRKPSVPRGYKAKPIDFQAIQDDLRAGVRAELVTNALDGVADFDPVEAALQEFKLKAVSKSVEMLDVISGIANDPKARHADRLKAAEKVLAYGPGLPEQKVSSKSMNLSVSNSMDDHLAAVKSLNASSQVFVEDYSRGRLEDE